jgi:hypothetical protein
VTRALVLWALLRGALMGFGVAFLAAALVFISPGCCTPQPDRLDGKKVAAYLDSVATVISMLEANVPEEQRALTIQRCEPINAAGLKLLSR